MDATFERKVEELTREIAEDAKTIGDVNGVLRLMMKSTLQRMLDTEMDVQLARSGGGVHEASEGQPLGQEAREDAVGNKRPGNRRRLEPPPPRRTRRRRLSDSAKRLRNTINQSPAAELK